MYQELISYTFDVEEWTSVGQLTDFAQLAYPDCTSEIGYGDLILTDEREHAKCLHFKDIELLYLALNLSFHAENLQKGKSQKAFIASQQQAFELELLMHANKVCEIRIADEPINQITMHIDTLVAQAKKLRNNLWVDMANHFPLLTSVEDYENMENDFIC